MVLMVGPTLEHVYQHPKPAVYLLHMPSFTAKLNMFDGLCQYLADDDDVVRLDGRPLFTLSNGKTELLFENTRQAFTWAKRVPASLLSSAGEGSGETCRWEALPVGNRLLFRMDGGHTQFEKSYFTVPGAWVSPQGPPRWKRIVATGADGKEYDAQPGAMVRVSAAEVEFPGGRWNLTFQFQPPQEVAFRGMGMKFTLGSFTSDNWQIGFCKPGDFDAWRGKK
jgi:hypothetical protein